MAKTLKRVFYNKSKENNRADNRREILTQFWEQYLARRNKGLSTVENVYNQSVGWQREIMMENKLICPAENLSI